MRQISEILRMSGEGLGKPVRMPGFKVSGEAAISRLIRGSVEKLRKLSIRLGQMADRVLGQPVPKLVPIPVSVKSRNKARTLG